MEEQEQISIGDHNYLIDMGFELQEFGDGSGFWYAMSRKDLPFFHEVEITYDPDDGTLDINILLTEDDDYIMARYFTDVYDLFMIETALVLSNFIPMDDNRRREGYDYLNMGEPYNSNDSLLFGLTDDDLK